MSRERTAGNSGAVTLLLKKAVGNSESASEAREELAALVHDDLHRIASAHFHNESPGHTLQTTAIVNEGWLKLAEQDRVQWQDREHFLAIASSLRIPDRCLIYNTARYYNY